MPPCQPGKHRLGGYCCLLALFGMAGIYSASPPASHSLRNIEYIFSVR